MTKTPQKKIIEETVAEIDGYSFEVTLAGLSQYVRDLIQKYGPDARVHYEKYFLPYDDNDYYHHITIKREETDEEFQKRLAEEKARQDAIDERERKEFERLNKKFGSQ
jgi:hypothetical protein